MTVEYRHNVATATDIEAHLSGCDADFEPRLSLRVEISSYSKKLVSHADRFEAWSEGNLIGLVAAYCNDMTTRRAFVTSVSVTRGWGGRGIGAELMMKCVAHAASVGMLEMTLEVARTNSLATRLYQKLGFLTLTDGDTLSMSKALVAEP
ncbi:MAG: GNAT family N-acetyltransferase [Myxococcaceae bacterium]